MQPPVHIQQNPLLVGVVFHRLEDEVPRNAVEEGFDVQVNERFSSSDLVGLKDVDGFSELPGSPGAAAQLAQDVPGLEPMPLSLS